MDSSSSRLHKSGVRRRLGLAPEAPPAVIEPVRRKLLDLDSRFFPLGIQPGSIVELRGPEGSGKTFLSTYFLARLLFIYPSQYAVLVDTTHHFSLQNLISILSHLDPAVLEPTQEISDAASSKANPRLLSYLNRLSIIECYNAEQFLLNFGPGSNCPIETMLLTNPAISLVLVDSVDTFAYISSFGGQPYTRPNILLTIQRAVEKSRTPVICTLSEYFNGHSSGLRLSGSTSTPIQDSDPDNFTEIKVGGRKLNSTFEPNIVLDSKYFTHSLLLCPQPRIDTKSKPSSAESGCDNLDTVLTRTECVAHLKSKHRSNPGMSAPIPGLNHRVKFSIFSGMLWVCEGEVPPK